MHPPPTITPAIRAQLDQAIAHHRAGRLAQAEQLYRQVLQVAPHAADANHNLGLIALQAGRRDLALPLFQSALAANPVQPQFLQSFAGALLDAGRDAEAHALLERGLHDGMRSPALDALRERALAMRSPNQPQRDEELALYQLFKLELHAELQREARRLLQQFPDTGYLWKLLGASLQVEGRDAIAALEALRRATALLPHDADAQNNLAVALLQRDEFAEAARYSRHALEKAPQFVQALRSLGAALRGMRDYTGAVEQFRLALALRVDPATRINLAVCLAELGRHAEALEQLHGAAREGCDIVPLHYQTGVTLQALGRIDEAMLSYRRALELEPHHALAHNNLGNLLQMQRRLDEAIIHYRHALDLKPNYADAHNNLGAALREQGRREEAVASFERALACRATFPEAHANLGNLLHEMGKSDEAVAHCRKAVDARPEFAEGHSNLGHVLHGAWRYDEALACFQRAVALKPDFANAHSNLCALYRDMGLHELSMQAALKALHHDPDHLHAHSGLLFSANYVNTGNAATMLGHAQRYGAAATRLARVFTEWPNTPEPERRLRIGLVSGDLHRHPAGFFLQSVVKALHESHGDRVALYAYYNNLRRDDLSAELERHCAHWRVVFGMPDGELAQRVREDGIDILLDLSGHTTGTRLSMFAWKPAPVQASWLGYFATTGLATMDYLVADPWTLPASEEANFTETVWRLPDTRLCFSAPDFTPDAGPLPASKNGTVTFGCCQNLGKLNHAVVALWARILLAVPHGKLLLKSKQFSEAGRIDDTLARFAVHGIAPERLMLEGPSTREEYFDVYRRIDFALDTFPYPGGTTTAEALWMGVPVLTLAGERFLGRQGVGLLANAGLSDWIAADTEDYLAKAVAFAGDLPVLARLREGLREQVLASPLFDASRFAAHFEAMLRGMWRQWCDKAAAR